MDKTPFPKLQESDAAYIAATLAAAACSMLSADNNREFALRESRHIFEEQYKFLLNGQWEEIPDLGDRGLD